jgi:hypothetical protein
MARVWDSRTRSAESSCESRASQLERSAAAACAVLASLAVVALLPGAAGAPPGTMPRLRLKAGFCMSRALVEALSGRAGEPGAAASGPRDTPLALGSNRAPRSAAAAPARPAVQCGIRACQRQAGERWGLPGGPLKSRASAGEKSRAWSQRQTPTEANPSSQPTILLTGAIQRWQRRHLAPAPPALLALCGHPYTATGMLQVPLLACGVACALRSEWCRRRRCRRCRRRQASVAHTVTRSQ